MTKCLAYGKPLKLIGVERVNGRRNYKDWETREYHKQCYLKIKKEENSFNYIYIIDAPNKYNISKTKSQKNRRDR